jgi:hypothetical protein
MNRPFLAAADSFVWSAWGEIGVPSAERRSFDLAVDLEPLIRLSTVVGVADPRLHSEAAFWLGAFPELVSRARLKRTGAEIPESVVRSTRANVMSGPMVLDVESASAVQLRIRSALGVSARAEIIRQLVLDTARTRRSSAELAQLCGYTKRNIEKALESLERGGWVIRITGGTSLKWSVADRAALAGLFSPIPSSNASFLALAEIVEKLVSLDDVETGRAQVRSATTRQLLAELRSTADWGELNLPEIPPAVDAWVVALGWVRGLPSVAL